MPPSLSIDHLVVCCTDLAEGVAHVEDALGVTLAPGGVHPNMGTYNALLSLGDVYLEVIAPDPNQPKPPRPRMFDLDHFAGPPRLCNWVAATSDIDAAVALAPVGIGTATPLSRGEFHWQLTLPPDGKLPFDGGFPGLIQWPIGPHPAERLPEANCRLLNWSITYPDPALPAALAQYGGGLDACITQGPLGFTAEIQTPNGPRILS